METVLGLSVTATNVQTVLVEGRDADGATLEHDELAVFARGASPARASEQVAEAVLSIAEADGHQLHAIGVTWSQDADLEAALVLDSLAGAGFENVVAVQLPQAAEALARSIGRVIGYERTAVCVVEHNAVVLSLVDTLGGEVETLVNRAIGDGDLLDWVSSVFDRDDWRPEGLFVVGSIGGLDALAASLERGLGVPAFDPPEAELALAHGAALASAYGPAAELGPAHGYPDFSAKADRRRPLVAPAPASREARSRSSSRPHWRSVRTSCPRATLSPPPHTQVQADLPVQAPAPARVAPALPVAVEPPAAVEPPVAVEPPAVQSPPEAPPDAGIVEAPVYQPAPPAEAPPAEAVSPPTEAVSPPAEEPLTQFQQILPPAPPPVIAPPAVVPQVPMQQPRLRDRILDKIPGLNRGN